jgi:hypothetical protein
MRILFYGGCHAAALRRIFERYAPDVEYVDHLTNFRIIRENAPVPYEDFRQFDWIIFSPILNKNEYNTIHVENFCRKNNIKYLKYPWLQWEGCFPAMKKTASAWWWCTGLDQLAAESPSFEAFREAVLFGNALAEEAVRNLEKTTTFLRRREADADVTISQFIADRYKDERLFLTPDHAAIPLYRYLVRQIADAIRCKMDESFYFSTEEVQPETEHPILPSVARALELRFVGGNFHNKFVFGDGRMALTEYLKMHFYKDDIRVATAKARTRLRADVSRTGGRVYSFQPTDKVLVRKLQVAKQGGYQSYELMTVMKASAQLHKCVPRGNMLYFYPAHWTFSRRAEPRKDSEEKAALAS